MTFQDLSEKISKRTKLNTEIVKEILFVFGEELSYGLHEEFNKNSTASIYIPNLGRFQLVPDKRAKFGYKLKFKETSNFYQEVSKNE